MYIVYRRNINRMNQTFMLVLSHIDNVPDVIVVRPKVMISLMTRLLAAHALIIFALTLA